MGYRSYLSSYETVLIKNKSVDLQRDIISTLTPAVFMSCLDFAFPIPAETSVDSKILLFAKFRSFTRNPKILRSLVPVLVYKGLELANLLRLNDLAGSRLGLRFTK